MNVLAIDTESNTWNKGSWSDRRFKGVCHSWADCDGSGAAKNDEASLEQLDQRIRQADLITGFNIKYDYHVLRNLGITSWQDKPVWDCQIATFVRSGQTHRYPSLDESLKEFELEAKFSEVATFWANGIQTENIPWEILGPYAEQDARQTLALFHAQQQAMTPVQRRLVRMQGLDLLVLEEMEFNGIKYNTQLREERSKQIASDIQDITNKLSGVYPDIRINFNSGDHLSAFLYGGKVTEEVKIHIGFFKTGARAGEAKFKNDVVVHELPRLVTPLRGTELKKQGFFQTNADTLLKLKGNKKTKEIIDLIKQRSRLDSLLTKTYEGIAKVNETQNWEPGWLYGQYNQVVAQTGRLSSSNPNQQNFDSEAADLFISRYED